MSSASRLAAFRLAARIARRDARRRPWRSALVLLLVMLPVGAITATAIVTRTAVGTPADQKLTTYGHADDIVVAGNQPTTAGPSTAVGDRSRLSEVARRIYPSATAISLVSQGPDGYEDAEGGLRQVVVTDRSPDDPVVGPTLLLRHGRSPAQAGEAAVTADVLGAAGVDLGDQITLVRHGAVTVVGVVDAGDDGVIALAQPLAPHPDTSLRAFVVVPEQTSLRSRTEVASGLGVHLYGPFPAASARAEQASRVALINALGGVALVVVAIVASAAFAVGARRQLRTLGLLSACGAPPRVLRMAVLLQGTTLGVIGSVAGVTGALVAVRVMDDRIVGLAGIPVPGLRWAAVDVILPLALGAVASTAAAVQPARSAARVPTLAALAGRRPTGRVPAHVPVRGAAVAAACLVGLVTWRNDTQRWWIGLGLAVGALLGTASMAPWLVSRLEPLAARIGGARRLAARGLARNRLRSGAVVGAIMAPVALAGFGLTALATAQEEHGAELRSDQVLLQRFTEVGLFEPDNDAVSSVMALLPGSVQATVEVVLGPADPAAGAAMANQHPLYVTAQRPSDGSATARGPVAVGSPELVDAMGLPEQAEAALEAGTPVVLAADDDELASFDGPEADGLLDLLDRGLRVKTAVRPDTGVIPVALIPRSAVDRLGLGTHGLAALVRAPDPLTGTQREAVLDVGVGHDPDSYLRAYLLGHELPSVDDPTSVSVAAPSPNVVALHAAAVAAAILLSLGVVAVALALDAAEDRHDRALLAAMGASPRAQRSVPAWQALAMPLMATVLAVPLGILAAAAVFAEPVDLPLTSLGALLLGLPAISGLITRMVAVVTSGRGRIVLLDQ